MQSQFPNISPVNPASQLSVVFVFKKQPYREFLIFRYNKIIILQHPMYLIDIVLAYIIRYSEIHMCFPFFTQFY